MLPITTGLPFPEMPSDSSVNNTSQSSQIDKKELVLILSREPDTRFLFKTLLEMWHYRVETAENYDELIFVAEHVRPSLILMDTTLPFVENMKKMQRIRQNDILANLPIVLISGHAQPRFRNLALSLGAEDFLVKPVDFDLLEDCLEKIISKKDKGDGKVL
jgi:CheY-like chemotaxis protein